MKFVQLLGFYTSCERDQNFLHELILGLTYQFHDSGLEFNGNARVWFVLDFGDEQWFYLMQLRQIQEEIPFIYNSEYVILCPFLEMLEGFLPDNFLATNPTIFRI